MEAESIKTSFWPKIPPNTLEIQCFLVSIFIVVVGLLVELCSYDSLFRNGTSMISLILPPKDQVSRAAKMLADEFGTASNIKSRVNRFVTLHHSKPTKSQRFG